MKYLLTGKEMSDCDRNTSEIIGIPSLVLMERAALAVANEVINRFSTDTKVCVISGRGNNGADGIAAGRMLIDAGFQVDFYMLRGTGREIDPESSMAAQLRILRNYGYEVQEGISEEDLRESAPAVIIDAMFGTGLARDLTEEAAETVELINKWRDRQISGPRTSARIPYVIAVDIPSGISSDDGRICGCAVRCDLTVTFAFYKRGHFMYPGRSYCGECRRFEIGITERGMNTLPKAFTYDVETALDLLPGRDPSGNKGTFGKVLIIAGSRNMCGAAFLSAKACMRSGAGMVKVFTPEANRVIIQEMLPEALLATYTESESTDKLRTDLYQSLEWADTVLVGPGLGQSIQARQILSILTQYLENYSAAFKEQKEPGKMKPYNVVIDADALRLIALGETLGAFLEKPLSEDAINCIVTPHLAEFAALSHVSVSDCIKEREDKVRSLAANYHCTVICKDACSMIAAYGIDKIYFNSSGNSGMASAGSGDVLAGMAAAFLTQFNKSYSGDHRELAFNAAAASCYLHGRAGDDAAERTGEASMTAVDLLDSISRVINLN